MTPFLPETRTALPLPHLCFSLSFLLIPFPPYTFFPFFFLLFSLPFPVISSIFSFHACFFCSFPALHPFPLPFLSFILCPHSPEEPHQTPHPQASHGATAKEQLRALAYRIFQITSGHREVTCQLLLVKFLLKGWDCFIN